MKATTTADVVDFRLPCLWIGSTGGSEESLAIDWLRQRLSVSIVPTPVDALRLPATPEPSLVLMPLPRSSAVVPADVVALARRWPLAPQVVITGSVVDGRRRSGPALPGVVEVAWHELPGRIGQWQAQWHDGVSGPLGLPATFRREERLLFGPSRRDPAPRRKSMRHGVSIVAHSRADLEGLGSLVMASGRGVLERFIGHPRPESLSRVVVWDAGSITAPDIPWIEHVCRRTSPRVLIILESFPRGSVTRAATAAGAAHVLGRPVEADVLEETIGWFERRLGDGLGAGIAGR